MSYNGSGTFQINSSGQPVVTGTVISSTAFNALTADLATGLSTAITKDGQTTTTARILFAQGISSTLTTDATSTTTGSIITAGGISCQKAAVVGTLLGVGMAPVNVLDITQSLNGQSQGSILNSNAGVNANAKWFATNGTNWGTVGVLGQSFTTTGAYVAGYGFAAGNTGMSIIAQGGPILFATNGSTEKMRLDTNGYLGINCTPATPLNISGSGAMIRLDGPSTTSSAYIAFTHAGSGVSAVGLDIAGGTLITSSPANSICIRNDMQGILFSTGGSGAEAARFGSDGSFLVGTTTNGGWASSFIAEFRSAGNALSAYSTSSSSGNAFTSRVDNTAINLAQFYYSTSAVGAITTNGTITVYGTTSDYRLKRNVQPMMGGLATVAALKPVTYDWISNGSAGEGFIAHELQAVIPDAVHGEKDALNEDGSINAQGVDFGKIVPHLVAAMQEQQATIQELTTRLAALENK